MNVYEVLDRALVGELTIPEATEIEGIPIRSVLRWGRCHQAGLPTRFDQHPRRKAAQSTQMRHGLEVYSNLYRGLSAGAFARALQRDRDIVVPVGALRQALRAAGLAPTRRSTRAALPRGEAVTAATVAEPDPSMNVTSMADEDAARVRGFQQVSERIAGLTSRAREVTVGRRRRRTTASAMVDSFSVLADGLELAVSDIRRLTSNRSK